MTDYPPFYLCSQNLPQSPRDQISFTSIKAVKNFKQPHIHLTILCTLMNIHFETVTKPKLLVCVCVCTVDYIIFNQ